jgi:hypothetical protein
MSGEGSFDPYGGIVKGGDELSKTVRRQPVALVYRLLFTDRSADRTSKDSGSYPLLGAAGPSYGLVETGF